MDKCFSQNPQELFAARKQRILDSVALKETDRVPFSLFAHFWPARYRGVTYEQAMHDIDLMNDCTAEVIRLLQPDNYFANQVLTGFGKQLAALDYKQLEWPGHGTDENATFQYVDKEYMSAGEYDDYLFDPTGFYLHKFMPRVAGAWEVFNHFPAVSGGYGWKLIHLMASLGSDEAGEGLQKLHEAGREVNSAVLSVIQFWQKMNEEGYPLGAAGRITAPFDMFADYLRGSKGAMLDMYRNPDKLLEAMDKTIILLMRDVEKGPQAFDCPFVFIPLHWGLDGFMSPDQFNTFYWPQLRSIIHQLIERDLIPFVLWEGDCASRLEFIGNIPPGKAMYMFEKTDMELAKDVLGDVVCLNGNVPPSLLNTGTPDDVDAYCKNLITKVGKGGGLVLNGGIGIPDEAKTDNVVAMARSVHKYAN